MIRLLLVQHPFHQVLRESLEPIVSIKVVVRGGYVCEQLFTGSRERSLSN